MWYILSCIQWLINSIFDTLGSLQPVSHCCVTSAMIDLYYVPGKMNQTMACGLEDAFLSLELEFESQLQLGVVQSVTWLSVQQERYRANIEWLIEVQTAHLEKRMADDSFTCKSVSLDLIGEAEAAEARYNSNCQDTSMQSCEDKDGAALCDSVKLENLSVCMSNGSLEDENVDETSNAINGVVEIIKAMDKENTQRAELMQELPFAPGEGDRPQPGASIWDDYYSGEEDWENDLIDVPMRLPPSQLYDMNRHYVDDFYMEFFNDNQPQEQDINGILKKPPVEKPDMEPGNPKRIFVKGIHCKVL